MTVFLGADPGQAGGMAALHTNGSVTTYDFLKMSEHDIADVIGHYADLAWNGTEVHAVLEKVHSMPGQGVAAMFKFGMGYGFLRGLLTASKISYCDVTPQQWQKDLGIPPRKKDEPKPAFKKRLRAQAQRLWPRHSSKITLGSADALLMAGWLHRKHRGK